MTKKAHFARPDVAAHAWNITTDALQKRGQTGVIARINDPSRDGFYLYALPEDTVVAASSATAAPTVAAPSLTETTETSTRFARPLPRDAKRFLITAAQNATPIHEPFWASLKVAAKHLGAELIVIPVRYKNPTSRWTESQNNEEWWAKEVRPYLYNQRKKLNQNLVLVGDVKTQPTATYPLNGFEGLTGAESAIIGHTKLQFKAVPVPASKFPKVLTTTGACTVQNFTDTKAGKLGAFHHSLSATLVEISGQKFFLRQVIGNSTDGTFIDLDKEYTPAGVRKAKPALGLVMGDTHVRFVDPEVVECTFGGGGMVDVLDPQTLVWHDVLDGYSHNPHHVGNPFVGVAKTVAQYGNVREEVEEAVRFLDKYTGNRDSVVVSSNHNDFLSRWIARQDWRSDPLNASFYLETALAMVQSTKMTSQGTDHIDPFAHWVRKLGKNKRVRVLNQDESFTLAGIECGMHGHAGPNGARGSIKNMSRLGAKTIIGHSHTPGINEGCYQAGTSTARRLEYTSGPSSWLNTHVVIYASGKRSLITIIDGEWKL